MNVIICFYVVIVIVLFYMFKNKEGYKKQKRQGVRMQWKRAGGAGRTLALRGTRYPKLADPNKFYDDIHNYLFP